MSRAVMDGVERRARLGARHGLMPGSGAASPEEISRRLVGLHGTDPTSAYLACWTRVEGFERPALETSLYDERSLLKILGMRRTMFVVPGDLAAVIQAACTDSIARGERARLVRMLEEAGIATPAGPWLDSVEAETMDVLHRLGEATAADLTREVEGLRARIPFGAGKKWQSEVGVSTRLLFLLSAESRIIRGRPKGTLVSSLYRWAPIDRWLPEPLAVLGKEAAQEELVRRYLGTFGPATTTDVKWWTGWTVAEAKRALGAIGAVEVELDGGAKGWVLAGDEGPEPGTSRGSSGSAGEPWVALLPALDSTIMGWQQRAWFLGDYGPRLFDTNGNAGPTIWVDGRAVGAWAQRRSGEIRWDLLEDVGGDARAMVEAKVAALGEWLGPLRFVPRFRTPLEQSLVSVG